MSDSKIWGPYVWYMIHKIAFELPQNYEKLSPNISKYLLNFYTNLQKLIPCPSCKNHYKVILSRFPINKYNSSGILISKWTIKIHNITNSALHKKLYTYSSVKNLYLKKGIINIDHKKLGEFIRYIIEKTRIEPLQIRKIIASNLIKLYPCNKCRNRLKVYESKNNIDSIKTTIQMNNWAKKLRLISQDKCT